jgi:tetratricopeptide (TPR) repeat protein
MEGLRTCHWALLFLSHGSTRQDSVCHDEIAMILHTRGPIVTPILVDDIDASTIRADLTEMQLLKVPDWRSLSAPAAPAYATLLAKILSVLNGAQARTLADRLDLLRRWLQPMEQAGEMSKLVDGFLGRAWLRDIVDERRKAARNPEVIWLAGGPGTGKSAFATWLALHGHANVTGINLCRFDNSARNVPANVLRTLAFRLALRVPEYGDAILHKFDVRRAGDDIRHRAWPESDVQLFQDLFTIVPADSRGNWRGDRFLLAIDGLEETLDDGSSKLADLLASCAGTLPSWLCLVITCRPHTAVDRILGRYLSRQVRLDQQAEHNSDLRAFAMGWLGQGRSDTEAASLIEDVLIKSQGAFLYLRELRKAVEDGTIRLDDPRGLPLGLAGLYERWFGHDFGVGGGYDLFRPLIEIAVAARQPVPFAWIRRLLGWTAPGEANLRFDRLTSLLKPRPDAVAPFHESLRDWLTGTLPAGPDGVPATSGHPYEVEPDNGRRALATGLWDGLQRDLDAAVDAHPDMFVLTELPAHLDFLSEGVATGAVIHSVYVRVNAKLKNETNAIRLTERRGLAELAWHLADHVDDDAGRAWAWTERGDVQQDQGDLAAALSSYRASLAIFERLAAADAGNAGWQRDLSVSHNKIGDVQRDQGDLAAALSSYLASLAIRDRLLAADPGNAGCQRDLSVSHNKIGDVQRDQGDLASALSSYRASLAIRERLAAADPGNAGWQRDLAISHAKLGQVTRANADPGSAREHFGAARDIMARLVAAYPGWVQWQRDLTNLERELGTVSR